MHAEEGASPAVLFADLAGFTALTEVHGDTHAADVAARFVELTTHALGAGARIVKTIGDAVMILSPDISTGLGTALALLRAVEAEPGFPGVRGGLHSGPVVERSGDVFGSTVNVAARLAEHAHVGQLLTTAATMPSMAPSLHVTVRALGETRLKNVGEPIEIFSIEDDLHQPTRQVMDPVCRMFVDADDAPARLPWGERIWSFCSFDCATTFAQDPDRYTSL